MVSYVKRTRVRRARKGRKVNRRVVRPRRYLRRKAFGSVFPKALGFPNMYKCAMRYNRTITLDAAIATPATYSLIANGVYNPDEFMGTPAGSHKPYPFSELIDRYTFCTVLGSKCTVRSITSSTSNPTPPCYFSVTWNKQTVASGDIVSSSNNYTYWNEYSRNKKILGLTYDGSIVQRMGAISTARYSARRAWAVPTRQLIANPDHANTNSSNPNSLQRSYFNIACMGADNTVNPAAITFDVLIEYYVVFSEKRLLAQS